MFGSLTTEAFKKGYDAAYNAAMEHKNDIINKKSSHLGCSLFVNDELVVVANNDKEFHAEMNVLSLVSIVMYDLLFTTDNNYREKRDQRKQ